MRQNASSILLQLSSLISSTSRFCTTLYRLVTTPRILPSCWRTLAKYPGTLTPSCVKTGLCTTSQSSPAAINASQESGASSTIVPRPCQGRSLPTNIIVSTSADIICLLSAPLSIKKDRPL